MQKRLPDLEIYNKTPIWPESPLKNNDMIGDVQSFLILH